ncbi:MepB family protein [Formosa sp. 3Alg 14/1]|uniref:MepB family protein n=1 Tax=Formosa sp. 3Alg 14/1 TaxID=3382190 RepID=UPI0039BE1F4A
MTPTINHIHKSLYVPANLELSHFETEKEGMHYEACRFNLDGARVLCRTAKITPKKVGQFVTFWNRNSEDITQPFSENDAFDFYVINVSKGEQSGQFVIPKTVGIAKGLVSTKAKEGKRGFRVYPPWDTATNAQAKRTQAWQLDYFIPLECSIDFKLVKSMYAFDR